MAALTLAEIEEIAKTRTLTKAERTRKSQIKNAEKRRKAQLERYYADHAANVEKQKERRRADPAKFAAYAVTARQNRLERDPDFERRAAREWREKHPDCFREYAAKNPEIIRAQGRRRRAREWGAEGSHTIYEIQMLLVRQANLCANPYCRADLNVVARQLDHKLALSRGGSDDITNLQFLCRPCNARKHDLTMIDWLSREERRARKALDYIADQGA